MPPINPKVGDTYTNQMGQTFKYGLGNNGQMVRIQQPKKDQTTISNPDFGTTTTKRGNTYAFITDPSSGKKEKVTISQSKINNMLSNSDEKDKVKTNNRLAYLEQQMKNKDAIINSYDKGIIGNKSNSDNTNTNNNTNTNTSTNTNTNTNNKTSSRTWNASAVRQPEPTYVAPDGKTYTGMTQEQFDNSMKMYQADSEHYYNTQRAKQIGDTGKTADEIFKESLDRYSKNPQSFSTEQANALLDMSKKLGYGYGYGVDQEKWNAQYGQQNNSADVTNNNNQETVQYKDTRTRQTSGNPYREQSGYYSGQNPGTLNMFL